MPIEDALKIAGEIAEALAYAHGKAMIHCDLKPANVMVARSGHVKLMDFGLTRRVRRASDIEDGTEELTISGVTVAGTPAYMPPEQACGNNLDARADVFAFGIMLYEMLAGVHPFRKKTPQATIAAILKEEPPSLEEFVTSVPQPVVRILQRTLAKDPDGRYPSARELWADIAQLQKTTFVNDDTDTDVIEPVKVAGEWAPPAIVILPFVDLSPDHNQEYLCDGLAEELIAALGQLNGLKVVSRTAASRYRNADIAEIRRALKVTFMVEGSVQKSGERLRIVVKLVDLNNGYPVWSEKYDRKMDDIFDIQDEISASVVDKLRQTFTVTGQARGAHATPQNVRAYEFYLKGRYLWNRRTVENLKLSIDQFQKALEQDAAYPLAYAGLADAYVTLGLYGAVAPLEAMPLARDAADQALEIDRNLPEALTSRACVRAIFDW